MLRIVLAAAVARGLVELSGAVCGGSRFKLTRRGGISSTTAFEVAETGTIGLGGAFRAGTTGNAAASLLADVATVPRATCSSAVVFGASGVNPIAGAESPGRAAGDGVAVFRSGGATRGRTATAAGAEVGWRSMGWGCVNGVSGFAIAVLAERFPGRGEVDCAVTSEGLVRSV